MKTCIICKEEKSKEMFEKWQQKCKCCNHLFKCSICKTIKSYSQFRKDSSRSSGLSSKCKSCADEMVVKDEKYYTRRRIYDKKRKNTPVRKARQFFKDCFKRLLLQKETSIWNELDFTKEEFINKFPVIKKDMHIDHCVPLSWFKDGTPIKISCSIENLQLLNKDLNNRKSNTYADYPSTKEYLNKIFFHIKDEFKEKVLILQGGWVGK